MQIINKNFNLPAFFEKARRGLLLLFDFDGTLAPFRAERMQVQPYPGIKERLLKLLKQKNTRIVIISGRALADLEKLLDISENVEMWGSHGLERKLLNGERKSVALEPRAKEGIDKGINICQKNIAPQFCEIKPYSVALHWRGLDLEQEQDKINKIENGWLEIEHTYPLEIHRFDKGLELRSKGWNKGNVVELLLKEFPSKNEAIAYLGDDKSDEEAFAALGTKGLKVLVRPEIRPTHADIHLVPPEELYSFLDELSLESRPPDRTPLQYLKQR